MSDIRGSEALALTVSEFCEAARVSRPHLYRLWQRGEGPRRKYLGNKILIPVAEAHRWIEALPEERVAA